MHDPGEVRALRRSATLRDGTPVLMRAIRPDDRQRLVAGFAELEPESIYTRFHGMKKQLSEAELDRFSQPDFEHSIVLVVVRADDPAETLIGAASCNLLGEPGRSDVAEVSFTVEEDYHGQGIASMLMATFVEIARARGLRRLQAEVMSGNSPMLEVFEHSGLPCRLRREGGEVHVEMDLDGSAG